MPDQNKITFNYLVKPFFFRKRKELKQFILEDAEKHKVKIDHLQYIFCSDQYLLILNKSYLKHNYLTDILTFPLSEDSDLIKADIYISTDRVKENSMSLKVPFADELLRVIFHGYLHLMGWGDATAEQKKCMREKEDRLINSFKLFHVKQKLRQG